jgi:hypothetical protein
VLDPASSSVRQGRVRGSVHCERLSRLSQERCNEKLFRTEARRDESYSLLNGCNCGVRYGVRFISIVGLALFFDRFHVPRVMGPPHHVCCRLPW